MVNLMPLCNSPTLDFQSYPGRCLLHRLLRGVQSQEADPPGGRVRLLIVYIDENLLQLYYKYDCRNKRPMF